MVERFADLVGGERHRPILLVIQVGDDGFGGHEVALDLLGGEHSEVRIHPGPDRREHSVEFDRQVTERAPGSLHVGRLGSVRRIGSEHGGDRRLSVPVRPGLLAISNIKAREGAVATTDESDSGAVASSRFLPFEPVAGVDAIDYFWARLLEPEGLAALGHASPGSADRNRTLSVERFDDLVLEVACPADQAAIGRLVRAARRAASEFDDLATLSGRRLDALIPAALNQAFAHLT